MARVKRQRLDTSGADRVTVADEDGPPREDPQESRKSPQAAANEHHQHRSLFIRSLPESTTTETLTQVFSQVYPVRHATVVVDPTTKQSRGYGFVTLADPDDAEDAKQKFHGHNIDGKKIQVELAKPRHRRGSLSNGPSDPVLSQTRNGVPSNGAPGSQQLQVASKLIVRNLPWTIKDGDQLATLFRSYGKVKQAVVPKKPKGLSAGFGFVMLRGRKNAEKALEGVNGKVIEGRTLAVDWAVEKGTWDSLVSQALPSENDHAASSEQNNEYERPDEVADPSQEEALSSVSRSDEQSSEDSDIEDLEGNDSSESESERQPSDKLGSSRPTDVNNSTIFLRNLPFTATDDTLFNHFKDFGAIRYTRVVYDPATEKPKGTGFVCFYDHQVAEQCIREARQLQNGAAHGISFSSHTGKSSATHSLLEDTSLDPTGRYTIEGRLLQISLAVDKKEAHRLSVANFSEREAREKDKRRLYLLPEGLIRSDSPLYGKLSASEVKMREDSQKQRQSQIKSNPSLHLSLTRLSVRNLPRSISSKTLKALAREAIVEYSKDVKSGIRKPLSKEELCRGGQEMREAEKDRKKKGKGIVSQAKIVFEGREGAKVSEESGAGRSRGYGFIEYSSHRCALMGLRWLNGHLIKPESSPSETSLRRDPERERGKRLIVEFAIENAQVVARRRGRETKARERSEAVLEKRGIGKTNLSNQALGAAAGSKDNNNDEGSEAATNGERSAGRRSKQMTEEEEKLAKRKRIIGRKRMMRKSRNKKST